MSTSTFRAVIASPLAISVVVALLTLAAFIAGSVVDLHINNRSGSVEIPLRLSTCVDARSRSLNLQHADLESFDAVIHSCYRQHHQEYLLGDFVLRRERFSQQVSDGRMLLLVVVAITMAGVTLAALQLLASYRIAARGIGNLDTPGELIIERDKISLKSSVTGLFILVVSLGFFALYVTQVHPIRETRVTYPPEDPSNATGRINPATPAAEVEVSPSEPKAHPRE